MAKDIENPCISVCQLNSELCVSCGRTKEDIRKWKRMKRPEKMAAVQRATLRLKSLQKRTLKPPSFTFSTVSAETDVLIREGTLRVQRHLRT